MKKIRLVGLIILTVVVWSNLSETSESLCKKPIKRTVWKLELGMELRQFQKVTKEMSVESCEKEEWRKKEKEQERDSIVFKFTLPNGEKYLCWFYNDRLYRIKIYYSPSGITASQFIDGAINQYGEPEDGVTGSPESLFPTLSFLMASWNDGKTTLLLLANKDNSEFTATYLDNGLYNLCQGIPSF